MAETFHLEIITPTQVFDEGPVDYVRAPGADGLFGVRAGHTNSIFALNTGEIKVVKGKEETFYANSKGYAEITGDHVQLLVETAENKAEIDVERAEAALERAKSYLDSKESAIDEDRAFLAMERALNRLRVAKK